MPVRSITLYGSPGLTAVSDISLIGVQVLGVKREGLGYTDIFYTDFPDVPPGNQQFQYFGGLGMIQFSADAPFTGPTFGRVNRYLLERVWVLYKSPI